MKYFEGKDSRGIMHYYAKGKTWQDVYEELVEKGVIRSGLVEAYVLKQNGYDVDKEGCFFDEAEESVFVDEEGDYNERYWSLIMDGISDDEAYKNAISMDRGNAYFQRLWDDEER